MLLQFIQLYTQIMARREETFEQFVASYILSTISGPTIITRFPKIIFIEYVKIIYFLFFHSRTFSLWFCYLFFNYLKIIEISFVMYTRLFSYICMYIYKYMYMFLCIHIYRYLRFRKQQYNKAKSFVSFLFKYIYIFFLFKIISRLFAFVSFGFLSM